MIPVPPSHLVTADGDYYRSEPAQAGRPQMIELSGNFGGATVTFGYVSDEEQPGFVADQDDAGEPLRKLSAGRRASYVPISGRQAIRLTGATGATAIRVRFVNITQMTPGS